MPYAPHLLAAILLGATTATACGRAPTEPASFTLSTQRTQYSAGDPATVLVTNNTGSEVEFGACEPYAVDVRVGGAWREVYRSPTGVLCIDVAYALRPEATAPVIVTLPGTLAPATYRVRIMRFEPATTNAFDVR